MSARDSLNGPTVKYNHTYVPALAAQDQKPALATHSAPAVTEQEKPDQPGSLASGKPRDPIRSPSKPGKA